jgi:hypothetical protein
MKTISLTYSHKELQFNILYAVVEGLRSSDLTGRGFFVSCNTGGDCYNIELWKSATASENGDGKLLHRHEINKGDYQMNDIRLGVMVKYIADQVAKFVNDITPILHSAGEEHTDDLVSFGNYLLRKVGAQSHDVDGSKSGPREVTHADLANWKEEKSLVRVKD